MSTELHPERGGPRDKGFIYVGKKDLKKVQKAAWDAGWFPVRKKNGIMWQHPTNGKHVTLHGTSSDHHAYANAVARFRDAGLEI